jgi:hypothetical protein
VHLLVFYAYMLAPVSSVCPLSVCSSLPVAATGVVFVTFSAGIVYENLSKKYSKLTKIGHFA